MVNGVDTAATVAPRLSALRLQQPSGHGPDGGGIGGRQFVKGIERGHLRGNAVGRRHRSALRIEIAAQRRLLHRMLHQAAKHLAGLLLAPGSREHTNSQRLFVHIQLGRTLDQEAGQIVGVGRGRQRAKGTKMQVVQAKPRDEWSTPGFLFLLLELLDQTTHFAGHKPVGPLERSLAARRILVGQAQLLQAGQETRHFNRSPQTARHAFEEAPGTIGLLKRHQAVEAGLPTVGQRNGIEERSQLLQALALPVGSRHPGRLGQHHLLEVFVAFQHQEQTVGAGGLFPGLGQAGYLGMTPDLQLGQGEGVIGSGQRQRTAVVGARQRGQSLQGQPSGTGRIFHRKGLLLRPRRSILEERSEVSQFLAFPFQVEGQRFGQFLQVADDGHIVLLTVTETVTDGHHLTDKQRIVAVHRHGEMQGLLLLRSHREGLRLALTHLTGSGICPFHREPSAHGIGRQTSHSHGQRSTVARAQEARHVGLHHKVFRRRNCSFE